MESCCWHSLTVPCFSSYRGTHLKCTKRAKAFRPSLFSSGHWVPIQCKQQLRHHANLLPCDKCEFERAYHYSTSQGSIRATLVLLYRAVSGLVTLCLKNGLLSRLEKEQDAQKDKSGSENGIEAQYESDGGTMQSSFTRQCCLPWAVWKMKM